MRSCGYRPSRASSLTKLGLALRVLAAPPPSRTIRGLADLIGAGEACRSRQATLEESEAGLNGCLDSSFDTRSLPTPFRCDGDDPIVEASSPSIAFASALNFIGGTGTSSSELSPIENFQACGRGPSLVVGITDNGEPRLRFGLDACVRTLCRDGTLRGKLS